MAGSLNTLVDRLQTLPKEEREQWLARFFHELNDSQQVQVLSETERELVLEGLADLDAGRVVSDEEMEAFWNRNRRG